MKDLYDELKFNKNPNMLLIFGEMQRFDCMPSNLYCQYCDVELRIYSDSSRSDGYLWACTACKRHKSVRHGTWSSRFRVSIVDLLNHLRLFGEGVSHEDIIQIIQIRIGTSVLIYEEIESKKELFYEAIYEHMNCNYTHEDEIMKVFLSHPATFDDVRGFLPDYKLFELMLRILTNP